MKKIIILLLSIAIIPCFSEGPCTGKCAKGRLKDKVVLFFTGVSNELNLRNIENISEETFKEFSQEFFKEKLQKEICDEVVVYVGQKNISCSFTRVKKAEDKYKFCIKDETGVFDPKCFICSLDSSKILMIIPE